MDAYQAACEAKADYLNQEAEKNENIARVQSAMKDESGAACWSMEKAMQPRKSAEQKLLKPVPSQFNFEHKGHQVDYLKQKLRHVERKDAAAATAQKEKEN